MKKIMLALILFTLFIFKVNAIEINSTNAILYNLNDDIIIYEKDANEKVQIASLTKIVTAITIIDNIEDLNQNITITNSMLQNLTGYAKAGLKVGDKVTYLDLLYALMLPSGADAAQALAISYSGDIESFVEEMNKEINKIGVKNTNFENPIGMDSINNFSTASDMAQILKYSLNNSTFKTIFQTDEYTINSIDLKLKKTTLDKAKKYDLDVSNITGSKTGYTDLAGYCLASTSTIDNVNYLLITLGADTNYPYNIKDAVDLYNYYSSNYSYKTIIKKDQLLKTLKIEHSKQKQLNITSDKDINLYLSNNYDINKLYYEYEGIEKINKKIKVGDKLGIINVKYDDELIYIYEIYLNQEIEYYNYALYGSILVGVLILMKVCYNAFRK